MQRLKYHKNSYNLVLITSNFCWLVRINLVIELGGEYRFTGTLGTFMISTPISGMQGLVDFFLTSNEEPVYDAASR